MSSLFKIVAIALLPFFMLSCEKGQVVRKFDVTQFESEKYDRSLFFDLTSDKYILGGIIIKENKIETPQRNTIVLPFKVSEVYPNETIFNTWATYDYSSLIDYSKPKNNKPIEIDFVPEWSITQDEKNSVYWLESGLKRKFIYNHNYKLSPSNIANKIDSIEYAAVIIPEKSNVFESRDDDNNIVRPEFEVKNSRFFKLSNGGDEKITKVIVEYMVDAAPSQKSASDFILKLAGILLVPILQMIFLDKNIQDEKKKKVKKYFIRIGIGIQILLVIVFGYLAFLSYKNGEGIPYFELVIILIGAIVQAIALWLKMEPET